MSNQNESGESRKAGPADYLANERTFLAWIRTSIALMGFGFVIVKFALFLRQIAFAFGDKMPLPGKGNSAAVGVTMVVLGAVMALLAYVRYHKVEQQLDHNGYFPSKWLSLAVTLSLIAGAVLLVIYLLPNI
jgi:Predicted membrane protein